MLYMLPRPSQSVPVLVGKSAIECIKFSSSFHSALQDLYNNGVENNTFHSTMK